MALSKQSPKDRIDATDNDDLDTSHVLHALRLKIYESIASGADKIADVIGRGSEFVVGASAVDRSPRGLLDVFTIRGLGRGAHGALAAGIAAPYAASWMKDRRHAHRESGRPPAVRCPHELRLRADRSEDIRILAFLLGSPDIVCTASTLTRCSDETSHILDAYWGRPLDTTGS